MLHDHTKILSAAFDLAPHSKTTTFCLGFCLHPSSMAREHCILYSVQCTLQLCSISAIKTLLFKYISSFCQNWEQNYILNFLKGVCHEIFDLHFFHVSNPSRPPLIHRLKYSIVEFGSDFTEIFDPTLSPRCASHRGADISGVQHTAEMIPTMCNIPRR